MTKDLAEKAGINTEVVVPRHDFGVKLHPHQEAAVEALSNGKILFGGTGVGKSITAATYYWRKEAPRDIYVVTTAKKRDDLDWDAEFIKYGVSTAREYSSAGLLTVISWNEIQKYVNVYGAFFIFDEQRLVGSGKWVKAFLKIAKKNRWILLSATPGDTWMDYVPVFLANRFYGSRTEFKREHVVYNTFSKFPKVDRYINTGKLVKHRNQLLVEMPYESHTVRHGRNITVAHDKELLRRVVKERWHVYENRPLREVTELFSVMRKVVNSDPTRLEVVRELTTIHPKLIVFYNFDYELEILRGIGNSSERKRQTHLTESKGGERWPPILEPTQIPVSTKSSRSGSTVLKTASLKPDYIVSAARPIPQSSTSIKNDSTNMTSTITSGSTFPIAEWNGHKHEPIPQTDRWIYLVQYTAGAEGWNCIETDAMVFYSLPYSYKNLHQAHGRIDRITTPFKDLYYYTLVSDSVIDQAIQKSLKVKKNFNERDYIRSKKVI